MFWKDGRGNVARAAAGVMKMIKKKSHTFSTDLLLFELGLFEVARIYRR